MNDLRDFCTVRRLRPLVMLCALLCLFGSSAGFARFTLTGASGGENARRGVADFDLFAQDSWEIDLAFNPRQLKDDPADSNVEACMIALPPLATPETFTFSLTSAAVNDHSSAGWQPLPFIQKQAAISTEIIYLGTIPALRVKVDPTKLQTYDDWNQTFEPTEKVPATLSLKITGNKIAKNTLPTAPISDFPHVRRMVRSLFINGNSITRVPLASPESTERGVVTSPPGDYRFEYETGNEIIRFNPASLGLTVGEQDRVSLNHHGVEVPISDTPLGDDFWFFAPRRNTLQDANDSVFATVNTGPNGKIQTREAFIDLAPQNAEVALPRSRRYTPYTRIQRAMASPLRERMVLYRLNQGQSRDTILEIADLITSSSFNLTVENWGLTELNLTDTGGQPLDDHFAEYDLNGEPIGGNQWRGRTFSDVTFNVDLTAATEGTTVTVTHRIPSTPGVVIDIQNPVAMELAWIGKPRALEGSRLLLEVPPIEGAESARQLLAGQPLTVGGFPLGTTADDLIVLDVTIPTSPTQLLAPGIFTDESGTIAVEFEAPTTGGTFWVQLISDIETVTPDASLRLPELTDGERLKAIYVRDNSLTPELAPLVQHRGPHGILELDPQAAYNAFNGGQQSAEALRDALKELVLGAPLRDPLPTVLLIGDSSLDSRNVLGTLDGKPVIPVFHLVGDEVLTSGFETLVDADYELLTQELPYSGGEDYMPDVRLGRLPVENNAELATIVSKIIQHDALVDSLIEANRVGVFVADNNDGGVYHRDQHIWITPWSGSGHGSYEINIESDIVDEQIANFEATLAGDEGTSGAGPGPAVVMYMGHGSTNRWASERILQVSSVDDINTFQKWPLALVYTCLNGDFGDPDNPNETLAEAWLFTTNPENSAEVFGGIAMIAPTGAESYVRQRELAESTLRLFQQAVEARPQYIGELFTLGRARYMTDFPTFVRTGREFILFGDPDSHLTIDPRITGPDYWKVY